MAVQKSIRIIGRTQNQTNLIDALQSNIMVFALGPAGSGKTWISVACAVQAYRQKEVERIVLVRPAVESGEHLGFLPGNMMDKLQQYHLPLFDALRAWYSPDEIQRMLEIGTIEVAGLGFMRGRNLSKAFIICDEFQNATPEQTFMMMTRLSSGSKMVLAGDLMQIDLPGTNMSRSGLYVAREILADQNLPHIRFCSLGQNDIVRHPVVKSIIECYERRSKTEAERLLQIEMEPFVSMNGNGSH